MPTEAQQPAAPAPSIQHRVHTWLSLKTNQAVYGIQRLVVNRKGKSKWMNCAANGRPLLYTSDTIAKRNCDYLSSPSGPAPDLLKGLAAL